MSRRISSPTIAEGSAPGYSPEHGFQFLEATALTYGEALQERPNEPIHRFRTRDPRENGQGEVILVAKVAIQGVSRHADSLGHACILTSKKP